MSNTLLENALSLSEDGAAIEQWDSSASLEPHTSLDTSIHLPRHAKNRLFAVFNRLQFHLWRCWMHRLRARFSPTVTRPTLSAGDRYLVQTLRQAGGLQTSLDALDFSSNPEFVRAAQNLAAQLPDSKSHDEGDMLGHCIHGSSEDIIQDFAEVLLWGLEERLLDIVENYIQLPVSFLGVNLRKDIPNGEQVGTRLWHLDGEDTCVVKVLVYLNDVKRENGPFQYVPKTAFNSTYRYVSPTYLRHQKLHCYDADMGRIVDPKQWQTCTGPAGSVIMADTTQVFHHGAVPTEERTVLIFAYATHRPKRLDFCKEFFPAEHLLPLLKPQLSARQWDCLWGWRQRDCTA